MLSAGSRLRQPECGPSTPCRHCAANGRQAQIKRKMKIRVVEIRYPAIFKTQPENGFLVRFADLPDMFTKGLTLEEARYNAAEALSAILCWKLDHG